MSRNAKNSKRFIAARIVSQTRQATKAIKRQKEFDAATKAAVK